MISTEEFERWWNQEGSAINPTAFEDTSEHVKRVSEIAWANGHYMATVTNAKSQQWKPIETYPKNGKEFMCIDTAGNIDIQWHPMVPAPEEYTHWMPLPAPPMSDK